MPDIKAQDLISDREFTPYDESAEPLKFLKLNHYYGRIQVKLEDYAKEKDDDLYMVILNNAVPDPRLEFYREISPIKELIKSAVNVHLNDLKKDARFDSHPYMYDTAINIAELFVTHSLYDLPEELLHTPKELGNNIRPDDRYLFTDTNLSPIGVFPSNTNSGSYKYTQANR